MTTTTTPTTAAATTTNNSNYNYDKRYTEQEIQKSDSKISPRTSRQFFF